MDSAKIVITLRGNQTEAIRNLAKACFQISIFEKMSKYFFAKVFCDLGTEKKDMLLLNKYTLKRLHVFNFKNAIIHGHLKKFPNKVKLYIKRES